MEIKKREERRLEDAKVTLTSYEVGNYGVIRAVYDSGYTSYEIHRKHTEGISVPIYHNGQLDEDGNLAKGYFVIGTVGIGTATPDGIRELIGNYNHAIEVAEAMTEYFLK